MILVVFVVLFAAGALVTISKINQTQLDTRSDASSESLLYPVGELPPGNLIQNPWFRDASCAEPSFEGWVSEPNLANHKWTASDKPTNPSPLSGCATAGRISVGESDGLASTVQPNQDIRMYQVVSANPSSTYLTFDMYWVVHTLNTGVVTVYGGPSPTGPWTKVWTPFSYSKNQQLIPPNNDTNPVVWLWKCYSDHYAECGDAPKLPATTTLSQGYAYYKVEFLSNLPPITGGFKQTGIYFSASSGSAAPPPQPVVSIKPQVMPPTGASNRPGIKPSTPSNRPRPR